LIENQLLRESLIMKEEEIKVAPVEEEVKVSLRKSESKLEVISP